MDRSSKSTVWCTPSPIETPPLLSARAVDSGFRTHRDVVLGRERRRFRGVHGDLPAAKALSDVVVGVALVVEFDARGEERPERLRVSQQACHVQIRPPGPAREESMSDVPPN
jgi:hypothetical protein